MVLAQATRLPIAEEQQVLLDVRRQQGQVEDLGHARLGDVSDEIWIDEVLRQQEARFTYAKPRTRLLGMGSVEDVLGPGHPPELLGEIVRDMQPLMPDKATWEAALADPLGWVRQIEQARTVAARIAVRLGPAVRRIRPAPAPRRLCRTTTLA